MVRITLEQEIDQSSVVLLPKSVSHQRGHDESGKPLYPGCCLLSDFLGIPSVDENAAGRPVPEATATAAPGGLEALNIPTARAKHPVEKLVDKICAVCRIRASRWS